MKADSKAKKPKTTKKTVPRRKKPSFEDGVRSALIAGVVVCAVILGAAGFFAVRSVLGGDFTPPRVESPPGASLEFSVTDSKEEDEPKDPGLEDTLRRTEEGAGPALEPDQTVSDSARPPRSDQGGPPDLPPERRGILVFVIDDAGNNLKELEPFLAFPGPLT
ncbi:MAG: divergent polysaccharide deacetylase family protein, partial [Treponema sp.]|nr:divergent polysaccharide deacetylase family protein [Treponema sp.]